MLRRPRGAELLVRVTGCTLCQSDLYTHAGRRRRPPCWGTKSLAGSRHLGQQRRSTMPRARPLASAVASPGPLPVGWNVMLYPLTFVFLKSNQLVIPTFPARREPSSACHLGVVSSPVRG